MSLGKGLAIFASFPRTSFQFHWYFLFFCSLHFINSCSHLYDFFPSANFVFCSFFFLSCFRCKLASLMNFLLNCFLLHQRGLENIVFSYLCLGIYFLLISSSDPLVASFKQSLSLFPVCKYCYPASSFDFHLHGMSFLLLSLSVWGVTLDLKGTSCRQQTQESSFVSTSQSVFLFSLIHLHLK